MSDKKLDGLDDEMVNATTWGQGLIVSLRAFFDPLFIWTYAIIALAFMADFNGVKALCITYAGCIILFPVAVFFRKLVFPYLDLSEIFKKACSTSIGAAVVVACIVLFTMFFVWVNVYWIRAGA